jgi:uncharacterized protein
MKKQVLWATAFIVAISASAVVYSGVKSNMSAPEKSEVVNIRKLTLTLGQSSHSVKMNPALNDQIDEAAFNNKISAYMNQPFDFTYEQGDLRFNVPRTHTLSLFATEEKLSDISVEVYPLFEDDFESALKLVAQWEIFFNGTGLKKKIEKGDVLIENLKAKFNSISTMRCGFNTGEWNKDDTEFSIGINRFEREIYNIDTKQSIKKPVYKVSINIRSINHGIGSDQEIR